jgi:co-chaperonin GroES (HSP10)
MFELSNKVEFKYSGLDEAFPACDPGVQPFGSRVLVQIRTPKRKTAGGIILTTETRETDAWNTQIAKVIAMGELAFRNRTTMDRWPEGNWCEVGEFVRVPKYGGDRWTVKTADGEDEALLVIFNDLDLIGKVTGDPLTMKAFI